jgi:hypothetical protein
MMPRPTRVGGGRRMRIQVVWMLFQIKPEQNPNQTGTKTKQNGTKTKLCSSANRDFSRSCGGRICGFCNSQARRQRSAVIARGAKRSRGTSGALLLLDRHAAARLAMTEPHLSSEASDRALLGSYRIFSIGSECSDSEPAPPSRIGSPAPVRGRDPADASLIVLGFDRVAIRPIFAWRLARSASS